MSTKIDWCDDVWNPVWGCTGKNCLGKDTWCYARGIARRFGMRVCGRNDFVPTWVEKNFLKSLPRKPSRIFVNSMSDVADWSGDWTWTVEKCIKQHPEHLFLCLSKRPWNAWLKPTDNLMLGYSVTTQKSYNDLLLRGPRHVTFLSIEPILERINLGTRWLPYWIIVGAETGNRSGRAVPKTEWLREIFGFCQANRIPLFFKDSLRTLWPASAYFPQEYPT
jgi:protein gp37